MQAYLSKASGNVVFIVRKIKDSGQSRSPTVLLMEWESNPRWSYARQVNSLLPSATRQSMNVMSNFDRDFPGRSRALTVIGLLNIKIRAGNLE